MIQKRGLYLEKKFVLDYERQQNLIAQGHIKGKKDPYWDNPYEIKAEKFGRKRFSKSSQWEITEVGHTTR